MHSILEITLLSKELYHSVLNPICSKYDITHSELVTLLFLSENPQLDTAADVVKGIRLTKSSVSMSVKSLQEKGLVSRGFSSGDHRSIHLSICDAAKPIIEEGRAVQRSFLNILTDGFSPSEREDLMRHLDRVSANIKKYHSSRG